jgi:hypothetical protein
MRTNPLSILLVIIGLSTVVFSQEKPELFSKIERVFHDDQPDWKIESIIFGDTSDPMTESIVFRSQSGQAAIEIAIWKREKDARDVFAAESLVFDNTMGKGKTKISLPKIGDENHMWTGAGESSWPTIKFRKAAIDVDVFAPSEAVAKRFVKYILEQL